MSILFSECYAILTSLHYYHFSLKQVFFASCLLDLLSALSTPPLPPSHFYSTECNTFSSILFYSIVCYSFAVTIDQQRVGVLLNMRHSPPLPFTLQHRAVLICPYLQRGPHQLYCTVLYCTVLYCTVLYCTVLYCTVLYCTVQCYTVLCNAISYCTLQYCTVL